MYSSNDPNVIYSVTGAVFILQINRPEKKNALTRSMYRALGEGFRLAQEDPAINVILIRGTDDCFTSGNDVTDFVRTAAPEEERPSVYFMKSIAYAEKPVIAAVSGLAIGIGTTLLLHCDLIYASEQCYLQLPFTRLGICPEAGSSLLLPEIVGHQRAAELLLLGDRFTAQQAMEYGLVSAVMPQDEYLHYAMGKAAELAALPDDAVQTTKRLIKRRLQNLLPGTIDLELKEFGRLLQTPDAQAIVQAFLNRKK
ncbi:MAG: enoyl-CoA hydratase [Pseudohongiellaceae bacterium]